MRSWIFRHLRRLEAIYGAEGRPRPVTEPNEALRGVGGPSRLRRVEIRPQPTRPRVPDPSTPRGFHA